MERYVAFLRGISPQNATMAGLARAFEAAGFSAVRTVLSSGNVAFSAPRAVDATLERRAEEAMQATLGRSFLTIVRPARVLAELLESDPFAEFDLPSNAKRVVSFLRRPVAGVPLPVELDGARILKTAGREVFTAYVPHPKGPVFMSLLERTFGTEITTRTLDSVRKCAKA